MTHEVELKFRIPPARLPALRRAVATRSAVDLDLAARYMETADGDLARARVALRLRREGEDWVQTLKAEGRVALQRLEHNVTLPAQAAPALDLARHDGTEAGARLREVLGAARRPQLRELYATEVRRTWRRVRHQGAVIEIALDLGEIRAGRLALPVREIEFELVEGEAVALLDLAGRWAARFGLCLDLRSKSERGQALAAQAARTDGSVAAAISPPAKARPLRLREGLDAPAAVAAMLGEGLQQALANASQISDDEGGAGGRSAEHLHQLRVGLRRLRSVLRLYPEWLPASAAALGDGLSQLFAGLGPARERDVRAAGLWPALQAAGAPALDDPEPGAADAAEPGALLRAGDTQQLWLHLLALTLVPAPQGPVAAVALSEALAAPLRRLLRQVRRDARDFARLDEAARHRLRRRIKRLRYACELSASLWPAARQAAFVDLLRRAQAPLGELNDAVVAEAHARTLAGRQPAAWFAVGWLAARRPALVAACAPVMAELAVLKGPWRRQ